MKTTAQLETKTGVFLEVEEYNALRKAAPYRRLIEDGYADIVLLCWDKSIRLTVHGSTTIRQLYEAANVLMEIPKFASDPTVRTCDGVLLEFHRRIEELGLNYGERLFVG